MKYGIPTDDGRTVGAVFGRAKSFAVYDTAASVLSVLENGGAGSEHGAGTGAASFLAGLGVGVVAVPEVGPKAAEALRSAGIKLTGIKAGMDLRAAISGLTTGSDAETDQNGR